VSEVAHLRADDIDSKRMLITIEQGKGGKDRNAMLSPQVLRLWWRERKRGELRQRYLEGQEDQLGALGIVVNLVVLWNAI
jgi:integrase